MNQGVTAAALGLGAGGVDRLLCLDQQVGQLLVGRAPGFDHLVGGDFLAEHLADRPQQAVADDRIVLGQDLQRDMLVDHLGHQRPELLQLVDVPGVHQHAVGQRPRLVAAGLVSLVEQRAHLGILAEHGPVEMGDQRFAASLEQRYGGLDDCTLGIGQHG
ncbi:hypothetical protein G039_0329585 [Pseudomonas aeruginosa VRFPA01]|nr:hypothetical protein G039_0329585 [Pseudomonas aeruginosa VRFPA01]